MLGLSPSELVDAESSDALIIADPNAQVSVTRGECYRDHTNVVNSEEWIRLLLMLTAALINRMTRGVITPHVHLKKNSYEDEL